MMQPILDTNKKTVAFKRICQFLKKYIQSISNAKNLEMRYLAERMRTNTLQVQ
jgi:hypothetical protein